MSLYFGKGGQQKMSNFCVKTELFSFFSLKFGLACRKIEAPQGF